MADLTQIASGKATAPTAGAAIATLSHTVLPAGYYNIKVISAVSNNAAADIANMKLAKGASDEVNPLESGVSGQPFTMSVEEVYLDGTQDLVVSAIGNATAAIVYEATIEATRVG